jgi:hypothetical protein
VRLPIAIFLAALAIGLASCSEEQPTFTEKEHACIAQRSKNYDPKQLAQCVDVCKYCLNGTVATCNTSCKLRGAS